MSSTVYDFAIVGAGAAGLQLALAMKDDGYFRNKTVLIVERSEKNINDRTWCFWEKEEGKYDGIITHSWATGSFYDRHFHKKLDLHPYRYKLLRSLDFYNFAKNQLEHTPPFTWVQDDVQSIEENDSLAIHGSSATYFAKHIFDSRIDGSFVNQQDSYFRLQQHFKGWYIEVDYDIFDPSQFVMMDFRLQWKEATSFTYVLPTSPRKALIEFTLFTSSLLESNEYDTILRQYIKEILKIDSYTIKEVEFGVIPMSDYPFENHHTFGITKIGTAGGWVRPSSGYSFKNGDRFSKQILENIKRGKTPSIGIATGRFRKYDTLLLDILVNKNELGSSIFSTMYRDNDTVQILRFLDEQTTLLEDLQIIWKFKWTPFINALLKNVSRKRTR
jgi:lycopene beta-cyclase